MSERNKLEFTYERPGEDALPLFPHAEAGVPCAFAWNPDLRTEKLTFETGNAISGNADIPWADASIREIHIESRYALELLNAIERPDWAEPLVRILPAESHYAFSDEIEKIHPVGVFCGRTDIDFAYDMVKRIGSGAALFLGDANVDALPQCSICVFPFSRSRSSECVAIAVAAGAKIVTSDAGSSIEWLTRYADPLKWLVVHDHDASQYVEAVKYMAGKPSTFGAICKP